jgi:phosphate starvation-inducible membrane PsiE
MNFSPQQIIAIAGNEPLPNIAVILTAFVIMRSIKLLKNQMIASQKEEFYAKVNKLLDLSLYYHLRTIFLCINCE